MCKVSLWHPKALVEGWAHVLKLCQAFQQGQHGFCQHSVIHISPVQSQYCKADACMQTTHSHLAEATLTHVSGYTCMLYLYLEPFIYTNTCTQLHDTYTLYGKARST